jgi:hypothetical protein
MQFKSKLTREEATKHSGFFFFSEGISHSQPNQSYRHR